MVGVDDDFFSNLCLAASAVSCRTANPMRLNPTRLAELHRLAILDSSAERAYDDITRLLANRLTDQRFDHHPMVIGRPFIRFYAAARLVVNRQTIGTL